jgi:hypothetical protein
VREPLFGNANVAIKQSGGFGFQLVEDPPVEGGSLARLLVSHIPILGEVAQTGRGSIWLYRLSPTG